MSAILKQTPAEIAARERELLAQGWTKQFTTHVDAVDEYVQLYTELGFQVQIEPWMLTPSHDASCRECEMSGLVRTVFVRKA